MRSFGFFVVYDYILLFAVCFSRWLHVARNDDFSRSTSDRRSSPLRRTVPAWPIQTDTTGFLRFSRNPFRFNRLGHCFDEHSIVRGPRTDPVSTKYRGLDAIVVGIVQMVLSDGVQRRFRQTGRGYCAAESSRPVDHGRSSFHDEKFAANPTNDSMVFVFRNRRTLSGNRQSSNFLSEKVYNLMVIIIY